MSASNLINELFGEDIYASFEADGLTEDLQGWGGHQFLLQVIEAIRPSLIIEVGVWKGRSAIAMAEKVQQLDLETPIICVDTWLGAHEHFQENFRADFKRKAGWPSLYNQFIFNVVNRNLQKFIVPLPIASLAGAHLLKRKDIKADLIHIDAGHGYLEVRSDIEALWPLLSEDGVMIFDDYGGWSGVTRAVNEFAAEKNLPLIGTHGKALISPSQNMRFRARLVNVEMGKWSPKE